MTYLEFASRYKVTLPPLMLDEAGVYCFECLPTGKVYVGCSKHILSRFKDHISSLRKSKHHNCHFQAAWNKYGESAFSFCILDMSPSYLDAECFWIEQFDAYRSGFNRTIGGQSGMMTDPDAIIRMREKQKAARQTAEYKKAASERTKQQMEMTPVAIRKEHSKIANAIKAKLIKKLPPEEYAQYCLRSAEASNKRWAKISPEERSAFAKSIHANKTAEEKRQSKLKMWETRRAKLK